MGCFKVVSSDELAAQFFYSLIVLHLIDSPCCDRELLFTKQGDVDYTGSVITIDNIILSNAIGVNKSSQSKVEYVAQKQDIGTNIPLLPINLNSSVKKIILDNQVLIIRDNKTYNVMGQEV